MIEEEREAIKTLKEILNDYQKIIDIEDPIERECEMSCYMEDMPFYQIKIVLKLIEKQQKELEDNKKFKKGIVDRIMIWDKEELPDNETIFSMLDTFAAEVLRLEDIEDKKVQVAIDFIEAKRDKYWKDKISKKIKEFEQIRNTIANEENQDLNYDMKRNDYCVKMLNELLEEK